MNNTPKANRIHIAIFGKTNVGKSTFLNMISGQDVSIASEIHGTTTDVVEKTMEILQIGPVVFLDTAGLDDESVLAKARIEKTQKIFDCADVGILIVESNNWTEKDDEILRKLQAKNLKILIAVSKIDENFPAEDFKKNLASKGEQTFYFSGIDQKNKQKYQYEFTNLISQILPKESLQNPSILEGIVSKKDLIVLVVPIDSEAPKGRLILPQVQTIRELLDKNALTLIVKETEYPEVFSVLKQKPKLVICDSQVVKEIAKNTPNEIFMTTFSVLFARQKGDFAELVKGADSIDNLQNDDKILIAEACSHNVLDGDIGRVIIPNFLKKYTQKDLIFEVSSGKDYPENLQDYKLAIHCGGCMINRTFMLSRIDYAKNAKIPITNYGLAISKCQGVFERVIKPFLNEKNES